LSLAWRAPVVKAAAAMALLFAVMNFHVLALDFTTTPPPSVSYSNFGPPDQQPLHPEHSGRPLSGYYTADPYGSVALPPFDRFVLGSITKLRIPFWNPLTLTGYPMLPEFYWGIFYPPKLLLTVLPQGHQDLYSALHILLAGMFAGWLCWLYARHRWAAVVAAATVFSTGFLLLYFPTHTIIVVVPWGVLLLGAIERLCRQPTSLGGFLAAAAGVAGLGTAGHPPVAIHFTLGALLFLMLRLVSAGGWRALVPFLAAGVCGVLLALPNAYGLVTSILSGDEVAGGGGQPNYYSLLKFLEFLFPYAAGPVNEAAPSLQPAFGTAAPGFAWGPPVALFAASAGLYWAWTRRERAALALAGSGLVMTLLGLGLLPLQFVHTAAFNRLNMNYIWIYPGIVLSVLAGLGLRALVAEPPRALATHVLAPFAVAMAAAAAFYYQQLIHGAPRPIPPELAATLQRGLAPGVLWAIAAPSILVLAAWGTDRKPGARLSVIPALLILALGLSVVGYYPSANRVGQTVLPLFAFGLFCLSAPLVWRLASAGSSVAKIAAAAVATVLIGAASAAAALMYPGLPQRYGPVVPPSYIALLRASGPDWRSYGMEGAIASDNLVRFGLPAINNENTMLPKQLWAFFATYVDARQPPQLLSGVPAVPGQAAASFMANRRMWDYLAVRYVLAPETALDGNPRLSVLFGLPTPDLTGAEPVLVPTTESADATPLQADLSCASGPFSIVRVRLSTYGRRNPGEIRATLADGKGTVLEETTLPAPGLRDNAFHDFAFPHEACASGASVVLRLQHAGAQPGMNVAAWRTPARPLVALTLPEPGGAGQGNAVDLALISSDPATGMMVFENRRAQPRAYLAERLQPANDWTSAMARFVAQPDLRRVAFSEPEAPACGSAAGLPATGTANVRPTGPDEVRISTDARSAGPLVLVDTYAPGWTAAVDGRPAPVFRVNGLFRGVCLPGPGRHEVVMRYRPPFWKWVVWAPLIGALLLLGVCMRRRGRQPARP
jgi:hypothetical protein